MHDLTVSRAASALHLDTLTLSTPATLRLDHGIHAKRTDPKGDTYEHD